MYNTHMEKIESAQNARIKRWTSLHEKKERDASGCFLVEGEHLIQEALGEGAVDTIITDLEVCPFQHDHLIQVTEPIMKKLSANVSGAHLIAVCHKQLQQPEHLSRLLILDGVQDPGNLGTLVRTAVSFSFDAVYCSNDCADLYNEKTIRSTQGALFHIPVIRTDLKDLIVSLKAQQVKVICTALDGSRPMTVIPPSEKMALILGNEGQGVSKDLQLLSDTCMRIEMEGFESLNVAVAGGIVMYHYQIRK
jgi:TrmH family RNA methyltransferase